MAGFKSKFMIKKYLVVNLLFTSSKLTSNLTIVTKTLWFSVKILEQKVFLSHGLVQEKKALIVLIQHKEY